jgi:hypothetical protein
MHALLSLASAAPDAPGNLVSVVVGSISILASIAYVVRMLTRMESKLDTHNETQKDHGQRLDRHESRLNEHETKFREMRAAARASGVTATGRHLAAVKITDDEGE